jgi:TP901 family phage tail tape measure protein
MAADIASDVGSAFGLAADQIGHIADVMSVTASSANTSIEMMGQTLKFAAPLAKAAGQSLEDTAAAIGALGNSGIKASMAGTDLALIMKKMGNEARTALGKMGVQSVDAEGNVRSVLEVMKDLGAATKGLSEADRLKFFSETFEFLEKFPDSLGRFRLKRRIVLRAGGQTRLVCQKISRFGKRHGALSD